jgi:class 3 adenylate cyclase
MGVAAAELLTGTVTFLLTDIQGSTELVQRLGDRWPAVAGDQRRLLREAVTEVGGHEVDARSEELFFAFGRAQDAVAAAASAQRALNEHSWPADAVVRVRMGLHTGEPAVGDDGGYLGLDVHRTARICAAGHGGQVLCSATTRAILVDSDLEFVDLGEQRLKGLERPERVFQLVVPGGSREFPPLRSTAAAPFEGAERELGVAALTRVRERVGRFPSIRQRPPASRRAADICFALRATLPQVPDDGRPAVIELARAFTELSRAAGDADRYLARIDRRALAKKLADARELGVLSRNAAQLAERLDMQLHVIDALVAARGTVDARLDELERRALARPAADARTLRRDVEHVGGQLAGAVDRALREVGYAAERLRRTWHPGIYRQDDVWVVPHHDSLGVERLARFHGLREARAFRKKARLGLQAMRRSETVAGKLAAGGNAGYSGAGGTGDGGGGGGDGGGGGGDGGGGGGGF